MTIVDLKIRGRVESLHLESGDRIIVTVEDRHFTPGLAEALQRELKIAFPDHECVIMAGGLRIAKEAP